MTVFPERERAMKGAFQQPAGNLGDDLHPDRGGESVDYFNLTGGVRRRNPSSFFSSEKFRLKDELYFVSGAPVRRIFCSVKRKSMIEWDGDA
jgi:hypothetical protein